RATRLMIGDTVALKVLHAEQVADPNAPERFRREAQAAARLKHPNAVMIHDFGISREGLVYLVMELVEGQSLRQMIGQHGPCTPAIATEIMSQACAALDEAHRQQIVHRDIKPDNIIVKATDRTNGGGFRVKVLDFGIAKMRDQAASASSLTQTGSVMGTPHYMSPEQCLGEELDSRSDVYSLGVVLYEMLTGAVPFNATVSTAVAVQHVSQAPPPLRSINPYVPPGVEAAVLQALAKQRDARPQTAGALAQMLAAASGASAGAAPQAFQSGTAPVGYQPLAANPSGSSGASNMMPTMMMSASAARDSSHSTPIVSAPLSGDASAPLFAQNNASGSSATANRNRMLIIAGAAVAVVVALAAGYFLFFNAKRAILAEARKGNLVTPAGKSAYDRYLESNLSDKDRDEVSQEVRPLLEAKGNEVIRQIVVDGYSPPKDECDNAARIYEWLDKLSKQNSYESRQHYFKGRKAFDSDDFSGAENEIRRAMSLDQNWALPANHMGRVYFKRKDYTTTQGWYQRAIELDQNWMAPRINLCVLAVENLKNYYLGEQVCRGVLQLDQNKASGYYFLGASLEGQDRRCEAVGAYQTAIEKASGSTASPGFNVDRVRQRLPKLQSQCIF
ncbi:MAG: serine/threonine-protein kinase, partial [Acidobacteriota bacterium]